jgi:hypothetical protein
MLFIINLRLTTAKQPAYVDAAALSTMNMHNKMTIKIKIQSVQKQVTTAKQSANVNVLSIFCTINMFNVTN